MSSPSPARSRWPLWCAVAAVALIALLPWLRNHGYLRDFYDYGLVVAANARLAAGERPYRDFATPIQAGFFAANHAAEKLLGGDFQGLTRGAAGAVLLAAPLLVLVLARRFPPWLAALLAAAVLAGSLSQHTILWHNGVGVVALALAAWSAALAPVWRRESWPLHLATAAALFVGGANKLNFHLVALAACAGWAGLAGWTGRAGWTRTTATIAGWSLAGVALPIAAELAWTGAPLALWWHDVVQLAAGGRSAFIAAALKPAFYLAPLHDHYGPLLLPCVGLLGVAVVALGAALLWRRPSHRERRALVAAALGAALAGALLLATNLEIAYVALAASLVLAVALWLGFDGEAHGARPLVALALPALVFGGASWLSAWRGQRSQFGTQTTDRAAYVAVAVAPAMDAYLRGTRVPPETAAALAELPKFLPPADAAGRVPVFYGPGAEWLERAWPAVKLPRQPLWMHPGTTYGPAENAALARAFAADGPFAAAWVPGPWDHWPAECAAPFTWFFRRHEAGGAFVVYQRLRQPEEFEDAIAFNNTYGGNINARLLTTLRFPVAPERTPDGRALLAVRAGRGELDCRARAHRLRVRPALHRPPGDDGGPRRAEFAVTTVDERPHELWRITLELAPGQDHAEAEQDLSPGGQPVRLRVLVAPDSAGRVLAGWRAPTIQHAVRDDTFPPVLRPHVAAGTEMREELNVALLRCAWRPDAVVMRGASVAANAAGLQLASGGEAWVRSDVALAEFVGVAELAAGSGADAHAAVRVVFRNGDRVEILQQSGLGKDQPRYEFRGWLPEGQGWIGVLVDHGGSPVVVRLERVRREN